MQGYIQVLRRNPGFARLWMAQAVSLLGDWFNTVVLFALVTAYSPEESRGMAISGLLLARFLPQLLVSPYAGVLIDRFNRKHLLIMSDLLRSVIVLMFLFTNSPDRLWLIYTLTVAQFILSAVFEPGRSALLPTVCRREDLVIANTLGSVTWSVMLAAGGGIGGLIAGYVGIEFALVVDALTFLVSALLIISIKSTSAAPPEQTEPAAPEHKVTFMDGVRYLLARPSVAAALLIKLGGSIGSIDLLMTIYATSYFVMGENGTLSIGILWSAFGIGSVLGPVLLNRFNDGSVKKMRRLVIVGYIWISIGWLLFGMAPSLLIASLALMVKAMGSSIYWTYSSVILQKSVDDEYLGRAFSIDMTGFQLSTVVSVLIVGAVVDTIGTDNARLVAYGTAVVSLIPLALWSLIVPWLERREALDVAGSEARITERVSLASGEAVK